MPTMFTEEAKLPDNAIRKNLVFMGYPFTPPLPQDDYGQVVAELQEKLPVRFWYFLDEVTTNELMRKIWRAILRSDLSVFDVSGGNPNVAFELGLAVATGRRCITLLKNGEANPLGRADLGYSERIEYTSAGTLRDSLEAFVEQRSSALKVLKELSYQIAYEGVDQAQMYGHLKALVQKVFKERQITKAGGMALFNGDQTLLTTVLTGLRGVSVIRIEGETRGAKYVFTDEWVCHDHEVAGE